MRIAVLGPTQILKFCELIRIHPEDYKEKVVGFAEFLAETSHEIVVSPDKNSIAEFFAFAYRQNKGKKVWGVVARDDEEFGIHYLNTSICHEVVNCGTWRNFAPVLDETADAFIVFGFGSGVLVEIGLTKWFGKGKQIYVIKNFISSKLPVEAERDMNIKYLYLDELRDALR